MTVLEGQKTRTLVMVPNYLAAGQIRDWKGFCQAVNTGRKNSAPNPGKQIWTLLGDATDSHTGHSGLSHGQNLLLELAGEKRVPYEYAEELAKELNNAVLVRRDFYTPEAFQDVTLPVEAETILARDTRSRSGDDLIRLNRLALEAAYPEWIKKSESWNWISRFAVTIFGFPTIRVPHAFRICFNDLLSRHDTAGGG